MNMKEESSFLQGIESRLDSLFGEDTEPLKAKDPGPPQGVVAKDLDVAAESDMAVEPQEEIREIPAVKEQSLPADMPADKLPAQDKSTFISEIEKRFSAIFGDEDKDTGPVDLAHKRVETPIEPLIEAASEAQVDEPIESAVESTIEPLIESAPETPAEQRLEMPVDSPVIPAFSQLEKSRDLDLEADEVAASAAPMSSIFNSPLKDMKSIILSIEWEISDQILGQFEDEVNKLYLLYTGDRIIQGFLRILRFLGRYIRVRGVSSNQDSITMLLSVYDHLENVMISEGMTEARRHIILIDNIKKYRSWVENTDIETHAEEEATKVEVEETKPLAPESLEPGKSEEPQVDEVKVVLEEIPVIEDQLQHPTVAEEIRTGEPLRLELDKEEETPYSVKEPDILAQTRPVDVAESTPSVASDERQAVIIEDIKEMTPHEAFAYAMEEVKKSFQTQLDALKEEIRILKDAR